MASEPAANEPDRLEKYRGYLQFLARVHMPANIRGKTDASDIVQQSLLQAHKAQAQFQGDTEAEWMAWLRQILVRTVSRTARGLHTQKRDVGREKSLQEAVDSSSLRLMQFLAADVSSPSAAVVREEKALQIAAAIEDLPELQREAVILRYWNGLSLKELAEAMQRSTPAVAGLLHRATQKLATILEE